MQNNLLRNVLVTLSLIFPLYVVAQIPTLGAAADYAVFTATGAFGNSGSTLITGNVGTGAGTFSGLTQSNVIGEIHVADTTATRIAADVQIAYGSFAGITNTDTLGVSLGNGQTITEGVYTIGALTTLSGILMLDAENDPSAVFIIKVGAAMSTTNGASVVLINGAQWENVYWQIGGQFDLGENAIFKGTVLVDGAINLLANAQLNGRAISRAGQITLDNNIVSAVNPSILPVTLTSFAATLKGEHALITWSTSNEQNSFDFMVERSTSINPNNWESIATIKAAGTSTIPSEYNVIDKNVATGINYYRLRSNDVSGSYSLSKTVSVDLRKSNPSVHAYPNPMQDQLTLTGLSAGSNIIMMDMSGKIVSTQSSNGGNEFIRTSNLLSGNYLLKTVAKDGMAVSLMMTKQ